MIRRASRLVARVLCSYGLAIALLGLLFLLTLMGTFSQIDNGLLEVRERYFESLWVRFEVGPLVAYLPGGALVMALLGVNLIAGGIVRLRLRASNAGVVVAHLGILWMLVAGLVEYLASTKGQLALLEGQAGDQYVNPGEWEIAVSRDGGRIEYVVPHRDFMRLSPGGTARFSHPDLPFSFAIDTPYANSMVERLPLAGSDDIVATPRYELVGLDRDKNEARDVAGCYITLFPGPGRPGERRILWARSRLPLTWRDDSGELFRFDLRRRRYQLPFTVRLDDFRKDDHPGTSMARSFESDVTVLEQGLESERITVSMNQPLRFKGHTLYQSSWGEAGDGRLYSQFSVVWNPADRWPEWACYVIAAGLLLHFARKLLRFVRQTSGVRS